MRGGTSPASYAAASAFSAKSAAAAESAAHTESAAAAITGINDHHGRELRVCRRHLLEHEPGRVFYYSSRHMLLLLIKPLLLLASCHIFHKSSYNHCMTVCTTNSRVCSYTSVIKTYY